MKKIVLLSCGKKKCNHPAQAQALYVGSLFVKSLAFAQQMNPDAIYILSAKHGLLDLDQEIEPYEQTLNLLSTAAIKEWAAGVLMQLRERANLAEDHFCFLAGDNYRRYLIPHITHAKVPMEGLGIGRQLKFLNSSL